MAGFENKWIWITGASSGLGRAMALVFSKENANLILSSRNVDKLEDVRNECTGTGRKEILTLDLQSESEFPEKVDQALSFGGAIDILINNGGISQRAQAVNTQPEVARKLFEVNFFGTIELTRQVLPSMIDRNRGHIVVISSVVGKFGSPLRSTYSASKHALHGYFDSLRFEVQDNGIDVSIICPGFIQTEVSRNALTANGNPQGKMDNKTSKGLTPEEFGSKVLNAIRKRKKEAYIGKYEVLGVHVKRFLPNLFHKIISRSEVT
ncbi:SDR family oxidoreductase [Membranihabitans maritimus]|uniref:SDR family oxidoreductase n=1 Tax=Membranihabitans maritimus TaxID=2904244 RepID=UPI001F00C0A3|nr:SDR family oxidoreductase [Membranihabitans maritimus]